MGNFLKICVDRRDMQVFFATANFLAMAHMATGLFSIVVPTPSEDYVPATIPSSSFNCTPAKGLQDSIATTSLSHASAKMKSVTSAPSRAASMLLLSAQSPQSSGDDGHMSLPLVGGLAFIFGALAMYFASKVYCLRLETTKDDFLIRHQDFREMMDGRVAELRSNIEKMYEERAHNKFALQENIKDLKRLSKKMERVLDDMEEVLYRFENLDSGRLSFLVPLSLTFSDNLRNIYGRARNELEELDQFLRDHPVLTIVN